MFREGNLENNGEQNQQVPENLATSEDVAAKETPKVSRRRKSSKLKGLGYALVTAAAIFGAGSGSASGETPNADNTPRVAQKAEDSAESSGDAARMELPRNLVTCFEIKPEEKTLDTIDLGKGDNKDILVVIDRINHNANGEAIESSRERDVTVKIKRADLGKINKELSGIAKSIRAIDDHVELMRSGKKQFSSEEFGRDIASIEVQVGGAHYLLLHSGTNYKCKEMKLDDVRENKKEVVAKDKIILLNDGSYAQRVSSHNKDKYFKLTPVAQEK